jgi:hypothetical protein
VSLNVLEFDELILVDPPFGGIDNKACKSEYPRIQWIISCSYSHGIDNTTQHVSHDFFTFNVLYFADSSLVALTT